MRDMLFKKPYFSDGEFCFNQDVVAVFDDMVSRSVPFYQELLGLMSCFVHDYFKSYNSISIYDLGCSTGNFLKCLLNQDSNGFFRYYGVDSSSDMLAALLDRFQIDSSSGQVSLIQHDLNHSISFNSMDVCLFNLVLQFVKPKNRLALIHNCYESLLPGGICFVVEKVVSPNKDIQSWFTKQYHSFKKQNGYSSEEIINKDSALNNVLVPLSMEQNSKLLHDAGFKTVQPFFQWLNFFGILAIKER
tara:strand:- start:1049 stop:1786 length:738 start_codon:yes stop_codon:yes gene_type:complete